MKKSTFSMSAVALSVLFSLGATALAVMASSAVEPHVYNDSLDDVAYSTDVGRRFVNDNAANSDVRLTGKTDLGVYQYIEFDEYYDIPIELDSDGAQATLTNGMVVNGNDCKSLQAEPGAEMKVTDNLSGYVAYDDTKSHVPRHCRCELQRVVLEHRPCLILI